MEKYIFLIPLFPLIGFIINGLFGRWLGKGVVSFLGCMTIGFSFIVSFFTWIELKSLPVENRVLEQVLWNWLTVGDLKMQLALMIDPLSMLMILVVTGVGFLIHIYSTGYMAHDESYWRYFSYLNMFVFFMSMLVLGANYMVMFVGWEGVGLASYLLIGFWYKGNENADAGKKAFIVNRIGDFGFVLGLFLIYITFGSLSYMDVFPKALEMFHGGELAFNSGVLVAICLLLFVGATGKSAQIPLYTWLPDAMAGPTPVSALIHAATMVTAGVYMVARSNILYSLAPDALLVVGIIAALTAFFAATMGVLQYDIKKILAYSTVSQLGYMFIGVGVTAYWSGIFHLMTHAFFKACLFLCAGSVIHAMSDEQDIRKMGGLAGKMPITYLTMLIATIAIAGIPPFAGFFSKDEILWRAFTFPYYPVIGKIIWVTGTIGAGITAFYMFRLIFLTFHGEFRGTEEQKKHLHESPFSMTLPLMILALLSFAGGWLGVPHVIGERLGHFPNILEQWLHPVFAASEEIVEKMAVVPNYPVAVEWGLMAFSVAVATAGICIAWYIYMRRGADLPQQLAQEYAPLYQLIHNKYYLDEVYDYMVVKPVYYLSIVLWKVVDAFMIDGIGVNGPGWLVKRFSAGVSLLHNGYLQTGGAFVVLGLVAITCFFIYW